MDERHRLDWDWRRMEQSIISIVLPRLAIEAYGLTTSRTTRICEQRNWTLGRVAASKDFATVVLEVFANRSLVADAVALGDREFLSGCGAQIPATAVHS